MTLCLKFFRHSFFAFHYIYTAVHYIFSHKLEKYGIIQTENNMKGEICMKSFFTKYSSFLAAIALVITTMTVNSTCTYLIYQDKLPRDAYKLRKF